MRISSVNGPKACAPASGYPRVEGRASILKPMKLAVNIFDFQADVGTAMITDLFAPAQRLKHQSPES